MRFHDEFELYADANANVFERGNRRARANAAAKGHASHRHGTVTSRGGNNGRSLVPRDIIQ
jgi:hypothetical protein